MGIKVFGQSSFITPLGIGPATPHYPIKSNLRLSTYPFLDHIIFCLQATQGGEESLLIFSEHTSVCVFSVVWHRRQMQKSWTVGKQSQMSNLLAWHRFNKEPFVTNTGFRLLPSTCRDIFWQSTINCILSGHPVNDVYPHKTQDVEALVGKDMFWS